MRLSPAYPCFCRSLGSASRPALVRQRRAEPMSKPNSDRPTAPPSRRRRRTIRGSCCRTFNRKTGGHAIPATQPASHMKRIALSVQLFVILRRNGSRLAAHRGVRAGAQPATAQASSPTEPHRGGDAQRPATPLDIGRLPINSHERIILQIDGQGIEISPELEICCDEPAAQRRMGREARSN